MKKLLLTMVGIMLAFAANATDYYLIGGFNGWALKDASCKFTETSTSGVYELNYSGNLTSGFKINDGTWSNANANFGSNGSNLVIGTPYSYSASSSSGNIAIANSIANPKLTLNVNAGTLLIQGQEQANEYSTVYLIGDFGSGWSESDQSRPMTLKAGTTNVWEGTYTLTAATSYFKMRAGDYIYGTGGDDISVVLGTQYTASKSGNAFAISAGSYTFTYVLDKNAAEGKLTVTAEGEGGGEEGGEDPEDPSTNYAEWYVNVTGEFNSWKDNGVHPTAEGVSEHTNLAIGTQSFKVKIWDGSNDIWYSTGTAIAAGQWVKIDGNADAGMTITGATAESVYNVEFDIPNASVKVTLVSGGEGGGGEEGGEDPEDPSTNYAEWYVNVTGEFNSWEDNGVHPTAEGVSEHTNLAIGTQSFKIKIWDGSNDIWYSTGTAIAAGQWVKIDGNADAGMTISGATEGSVYNVEFDIPNASVKVTLVSGGEGGGGEEGGEDPEDPSTYPALYLRGAFNDWGTSDQMTESNGVYTVTVASLSGEFKIADAGWSEHWTSNNTSMELGVAYECVCEGNSGNMAMAKTINNATVTFNYDAKTITVTGTEYQGEVVVKYFVKGQYSDPAWSDCEMAEEAETSSYVYEAMPAVTEGALILYKTENGVAKAYYKAASAEDVLTVENSLYLVDNGGVDVNFNFAGCDKIKFYFNPTTLQLSVKNATGINSIYCDYDENADYYTLQGVRVNGQPVSGLYIVVRGQKATKEYVK